jgi:hypothetical protein
MRITGWKASEPSLLDDDPRPNKALQPPVADARRCAPPPWTPQLNASDPLRRQDEGADGVRVRHIGFVIMMGSLGALSAGAYVALLALVVGFDSWFTGMAYFPAGTFAVPAIAILAARWARRNQIEFRWPRIAATVAVLSHLIALYASGFVLAPIAGPPDRSGEWMMLCSIIGSVVVMSSLALLTGRFLVFPCICALAAATIVGRSVVSLASDPPWAIAISTVLWTALHALVAGVWISRTKRPNRPSQ